MGASVYENVLGLDVSMADSFCVNVRNATEHLVWVKLYEQIWYHLFHLEVLFHYSIAGVGNVVHYHIQIDLLGFVSICVKRLPHFDAVRVVKHFQNLQFSILVSLVLEHFLDGHSLTGLCNCRLEYYSKGPIPDNFLSVVGETLLKRVKYE